SELLMRYLLRHFHSRKWCVAHCCSLDRFASTSSSPLQFRERGCGPGFVETGERAREATVRCRSWPHKRSKRQQECPPMVGEQPRSWLAEPDPASCLDTVGVERWRLDCEGCRRGR